MPVVEIESVEQFKNILLDTQVEKHNKKYVIVDFSAEWCGPCKRFAPTYTEFSETYGKNVFFCKVDVDKVEELTVKYKVSGMPTFMFFDVGNEESTYDVVVGANNVKSIQNRLEYFNTETNPINDF
jgi:thioredoxin 1